MYISDTSLNTRRILPEQTPLLTHISVSNLYCQRFSICNETLSMSFFHRCVIMIGLAPALFSHSGHGAEIVFRSRTYNPLTRIFGLPAFYSGSSGGFLDATVEN